MARYVDVTSCPQTYINHFFHRWLFLDNSTRHSHFLRSLCRFLLVQDWSHSQQHVPCLSGYPCRRPGIAWYCHGYRYQLPGKVGHVPCARAIGYLLLASSRHLTSRCIYPCSLCRLEFTLLLLLLDNRLDWYSSRWCSNMAMLPQLRHFERYFRSLARCCFTQPIVFAIHSLFGLELWFKHFIL